MLQEARIVCVSGMHCSGTSATARILNLLGVDFGPPEVAAPARRSNTRGLWEHPGLTRLSEDILKALGGSWSDPPTLEPDWEKSSALDPFRTRALQILEPAFGESSLWGWKDPRNSLLVPFWEDLLGPMHHVICIRSPVDVAASLEQRDGMDSDHAFGLWNRYVEHALAATSDRPRALVAFEDLLSGREPIERLAGLVDRVETAATPEFRSAMEEWLDPNLWHHRDGTGQQRWGSAASRAAAERYAGLRAHARDGSAIAPERPEPDEQTGSEGATTAERFLECSWRLLELYEQTTARQIARLIPERMEYERRRAAETLEPLQPWRGLPERSYRTYTGGPNHVRLRRILDFIEPGDRILDIGIGYGYVTSVLLRTGLPEYYCGVDLTDRFIDTAREGIKANGLTDDNVSLEVLDLYDMTRAWTDGHRPTLVLLLEVLEHLPDAEAAFQRLGSELDPQTSILFTVPMIGRLEGIWGHHSVFDGARIRRLCEQAGLTIHHVEPLHNTWILVLASGSDAPLRRLSALAAEAGPATARRPARQHYSFETVDLSGPAENYRRIGNPRRGRARLEADAGRLSCEVTAGDDSGPQYGGVGFPASKPDVVRLEVSFERADQVQAVHLHGLNKAGASEARWTMSTRRPLPQDRKTFVIRVDDGEGLFRPAGRIRAQRIQRLELFVEIDEASDGARFTLHRAAYLPQSAF